MLSLRLLSVLALAVTTLLSSAQEAPAPATAPHADDAPAVRRQWHDINYAGDSLEAHTLDIYLPAITLDNIEGRKGGVQIDKVVVLIYGSAWFANNAKDKAFAYFGRPLLDAGFAVVSINHRASGEAKFPAQLHDVKAALRFIRAHAYEYGLDTTFVGITGYSSGGHLAALAGVTCGMTERTVGGTTIDVEGSVGGNLDYSSSVDAVVDWFGPVDMSRMEDCSTVKDARSPEAVLIGGAPADHPDQIALISPISYVALDGPTAPRFLVIHGDADSVVPYCQSVYFSDTLRAAGRLDDFITVPGGEHGPRTFNDETFRRMTDFFLRMAEE